jgi:glycine dehydrogenase subunit 1
MTYVPHTERETGEMLAAIGLSGMEDLFADVPAALRFPTLDLPPASSELDIMRDMRALAGRNHGIDPSLSFLGAGTYHHFRPATVDDVLRRGEFYTSYTQYQPETSQGMLQALFEYQTMICRLTGMEVSNASHYDGAAALAEAVLLALNAGERKRRKIILSGAVHPQYRALVRTYLSGIEATVVGDEDGRSDLDRLMRLIDRDTAALVIQNPNFFGQCEPVDGLADTVHRAGALLIAVTDPIALGLLRPPASYGADVAVAEGQSLGIPPSFGGPHLGIFATRLAHVRRISGHLVGETVDIEGRRGYVLTLATREQHIRRARATSNICTKFGGLRAGGGRVSRDHGQAGPAKDCRAVLSKKPLRRRRDRQARRIRRQPAGAGAAVLQGIRGAAAAVCGRGQPAPARAARHRRRL